MNENPERETMRALIVALTAWVNNETPPPDSKYPSLTTGLLKADNKESLQFPSIPEIPAPYGLVNPLLDYDFGPHLISSDLSGYIDKEPPMIRQVLPTLVPAVDGDGNENSGVPSVQLEAPLGTYLGWNITRTGVFSGQLCSLNGGFVPFAKTREERLRSGDPRPSIQERYGSRRGYVCAVEKAARRSVEQRFLLGDDARRLVAEATTAVLSGDLNFLPVVPDPQTVAICNESM
jgi:hypothetical protein